MIKLISREYENAFRPEKTTYVIGNVGDRVKAKFVIDVSCELVLSNAEPLMYDGANQQFTLANGKSWGDYGFAEGDSGFLEYDATFTDIDGNQSTIRTINIVNFGIIQGSVANIISTNITPFPSVLPGMVDSHLSYSNIVIRIDKQIESLDLDYTLVANSDVDSLTLNSFIDGSVTKLRATNVSTTTSGALNLVGLQSGMAFIASGCKWRFLNKPDAFTYRYEIELEYLIHNFYDNVTDFMNGVFPDNVQGQNALTDSYQFVGYPQFNNPNVTIKSDISRTKQLGNTGWFNENYNDLPNDFTVQSVDFSDYYTGVPLAAVNYAGLTKVKAVISGIQNIGQLKSYPLWAWLPMDKSTYLDNKLTPFHWNTRVSNMGSFPPLTITSSPNPSFVPGYQTDLSVLYDGMTWQYLHTYIQGGNLVFEGVLIPSPPFTTFYENNPSERNYVLALSVANNALGTRQSNRVTLILHKGEMIKYIPPIGAWNPSQQNTFTYSNEDTRNLQQCSDMYVEDVVLKGFDFGIDISQNKRPQSIEFVIEAENATTGQKVTYESRSIDLTTFPSDNNGVPQYNYSSLNGYQLWNNSVFNETTLKRNPSLDSGTIKYYSALVGYTIRYEDWIEKTGMPSSFFNSNAPHNGFNENWLSALQAAGWRIQFTVYINVPNGSGIDRYENEYPFIFKDLNSNNDLVKTWSARREDNTPLAVQIDSLTGEPLLPILNNERTILKCEFTKQSGVFGNIANFAGEFTIEIRNGLGEKSVRRAIDYFAPEQSNPLEPLIGEISVKKTLVSANVISLEIAVEPTKLEQAREYRITSRLICGITPRVERFNWVNELGEKFINNDNNYIIFNNN